MKGWIKVKLIAMQPGLLGQHGIHVLVWDDGHALDVLVVAGNPVLVYWDVFGIQEFTAWAVFSCNQQEL